jgi:23S rRNA pseudouridine1911/1915/1917 synthase
LGDPEYGYKKQRFELAGQMLHSYKLTIRHPETEELMSFVAPVPEYMEKVIKKLQNS